MSANCRLEDQLILSSLVSNPPVLANIFEPPFRVWLFANNWLLKPLFSAWHHRKWQFPGRARSCPRKRFRCRSRALFSQTNRRNVKSASWSDASFSGNAKAALQQRTQTPHTHIHYTRFINLTTPLVTLICNSEKIAHFGHTRSDTGYNLYSVSRVYMFYTAFFLCFFFSATPLTLNV